MNTKEKINITFDKHIQNETKKVSYSLNSIESEFKKLIKNLGDTIDINIEFSVDCPRAFISDHQLDLSAKLLSIHYKRPVEIRKSGNDYKYIFARKLENYLN